MNQYDNPEILSILQYLSINCYCVSVPYNHSFFNVNHGSVFVSFCAMPSGDIVFRRYDYIYPGSYGHEIDIEEFYILFPRRLKGKG